jgi:hypothetical protein
MPRERAEVMKLIEVALDLSEWADDPNVDGILAICARARRAMDAYVEAIDVVCRVREGTEAQDFGAHC